MHRNLRNFSLGIAILVAASCYNMEPDVSQSVCSEDPPTCPTGMVCAEGSCKPVPAPKCAESLAFVGAGDFSIRLKLATKTTQQSTLLFQRLTCDASNDFWDLQLLSTGRLNFWLLEAGAMYTDLPITRVVNDGSPHDISIRRVGGVLIAEVDGQLSGYVGASQRLGDLAPLGIATGDPCEVTGDVKPLAGTLSEVCLTLEPSSD